MCLTVFVACLNKWFVYALFEMFNFLPDTVCQRYHLRVYSLSYSTALVPNAGSNRVYFDMCIYQICVNM